MEDEQLRSVNRRFPVWIIEHVWTHRTAEILHAVEPSDWPDVDSQPLSVDAAWRLRVASAQAFCIVNRRRVEHFEKVLSFLSAAHRLFPRLVAPIKHMKIMFGLQTLVIMWMLRERRHVMDTLLKISQFFPGSLPQYQDQCSRRQMFLMRKNHLDFKNLAQALATDQDKRQEYIQGTMQQQYGEHYAQKVEERLLLYLHLLEEALPTGTFVDKILQKNSPMSDEEKLLLRVVASDCSTIAATLSRLLRCEPAPPSELQQEVGGCQTSDVLDNVAAQEVPVDVAEGACPPDVCKRTNGGDCAEPINRDAATAASPQFCSKHQRWVRSILQECPDDQPPPRATGSSPSPPLHAAGSSPSPLLFQSSSSTSSSHDLTPSGLIPCPPAPLTTDGPTTLLTADPQPGSAPPDEAPPPPLTSAACSSSPSGPRLASRRETPGVRDSSLTSAAPRTLPPSDPAIFVTSDPATPVTSDPAIFVTSDPATPVTSDSVAPVTSDPAQLTPRLRLSVRSQAALLLSAMFQPHVRLTRVDACDRAPPEDESDASFDVNSLFSSSSSCGDDSSGSDLEYKPPTKKKTAQSHMGLD